MMGTLALKPVPAHQPDPIQQNAAAFSIDGKIVLVDTADYELDGTALAAVVRFDGSIGLERARFSEQKFWFGHRSGLYDKRDGSGMTLWSAKACVILGRVIDAA